MAKVLGIGGVFFKADDPAGLGDWYRRWIGVPVEDAWGGASFHPAAMLRFLIADHSEQEGPLDVPYEQIFHRSYARLRGDVSV